MAKDKLTDYDATASNNTDVGGISVAEGMLPSGVNNAIREQMSHLADFASGTSGVDVLKLQDDTDTNSIKLQAPASVTADTTFTMPDGDGSADQVLKTDGSGQLGWADRHANPSLIINGAMQVAQRGTSVSVSSGAGYKTVDRWHYTYGDGTAGEFSTWTMSQDTDAPEGFASSTKFICTTAASAPSARTSTLIQQRIEGQNLQHLKYGLSSANKLTASFWVKSNNTGTIGVTLLQTGNTRLYVESVSINSANTWEYKTITFDGDTANSLANDNTEELAIRFAWEYNTDRIGGSASWGASGTPDGQSYLAPTGTSARTTSLNDTFYITGVKLEVGETATPFEHRSYGDELRRCQRYYFRFNSVGTSDERAIGFSRAATSCWVPFHFPVTMRDIPNDLETSGTASHYAINIRAGTTTCNAVPTNNQMGADGAMIAATVASGLTLGEANGFRFTNADAFLAWDAEL